MLEHEGEYAGCTCEEAKQKVFGFDIPLKCKMGSTVYARAMCKYFEEMHMCDIVINITDSTILAHTGTTESRIIIRFASKVTALDFVNNIEFKEVSNI